MVEVGVKHVAERERRDHDENRDKRRYRNMHRLLDPVRPVDLGRFVQSRINTGKRSKNDNRVKAEFLPYIAENNREPEPEAVAEEENRLDAEYTRQELVDQSGLGKHVDQNAGERNPRKKVRQIDERLDRSFEPHVPYLVKQQGENKRNDQVHNDLGAGKKERIPRNLQKILILEHVAEMFESDPRRAGYAESGLIILKRHDKPGHGKISKNENQQHGWKHHQMQHPRLLVAAVLLRFLGSFRVWLQ